MRVKKLISRAEPESEGQRSGSALLRGLSRGQQGQEVGQQGSGGPKILDSRVCQVRKLFNRVSQAKKLLSRDQRGQKVA